MLVLFLSLAICYLPLSKTFVNKNVPPKKRKRRDLPPNSKNISA